MDLPKKKRVDPIFTLIQSLPKIYSKSCYFLEKAGKNVSNKKEIKNKK